MRWWLAALVLLAGCGKYEEFQLPVPANGPSIRGWTWKPSREPQLLRGDPGEFDSVDALNPSIVRFQGRYWNFYSGWDGRQWRSGLAVSDDGEQWQKRGPFLAPSRGTWEGDYIAANGAAVRFGSAFHYYYQAGSPPQIGMATSSDGHTWTRLPGPVLPLGPRGAWDERGVGDPYVVAAAGRLYMFHLGQDRARRQRLGVAVSNDGVRWAKLRSNPILELGAAGDFDETGLGEPAVWQQAGFWWMLYTGRDRREWRRIGIAHSEDGVTWERMFNAPVIPTGSSWNSRVVCDPEVEPTPDGRIRVWFGGGDQPQPAENLNGQIGFGWLSPIP